MFKLSCTPAWRCKRFYDVVQMLNSSPKACKLSMQLVVAKFSEKLHFLGSFTCINIYFIDTPTQEWPTSCPTKGNFSNSLAPHENDFNDRLIVIIFQQYLRIEQISISDLP